MKPRLIAVLVLASALPLLAQQSGGDQDLELVRPPTGGTFIQWEAKAGRTYFVQVSNPAAPLQKWVFAPTIEVGVGQTISYEVPSTADKGFFRLKYTDIPIPSGVSPEDADPDGDGLTNEVELTGTETDPLEADTDHDSLPDGWEAGHGLDPNDDGSGSVDNGPEGDPDHDGVPNGDEWDADTDPSNADSDSDGITDGGELDQGSDPNDPVDKPEAEWFVLTGDSPQGVATSRSRTVAIPKGESRLVVVMLASENFVAGFDDQVVLFSTQTAAGVVDIGSGFFESGVGSDHFPGNQILSNASLQIASIISKELKRDPFTPRTIDFNGEVVFDVRARLGQLQKAQCESFVPLVVQEII